MQAVRLGFRTRVPSTCFRQAVRPVLALVRRVAYDDEHAFVCNSEHDQTFVC